MTSPDDQTLRDIRRWYQKHGMPFLEEDWGPKDENGESVGQQVQHPERSSGPSGSVSVRSSASTPDRMWWWEKQQYPWRRRTDQERDWSELLEDFFAPYLAMLPRPKGNLVAQVFNDLNTYTEVGEAERISKQSAHEGVLRAVRDLTRLVAADDDTWKPPTDGRRRDYEAEQAAAKRVFVRYLGRRYP